MKRILEESIRKLLTGDTSRLTGDYSRLSGNCTSLYGDCTGLSGNLDAAEITTEERTAGVDIRSLISL